MVYLFVVTFFVASFAAFYLYRRFYALNYFKRIGVPHPEPHWFFGNLKELWATNNRHLVYENWGKKYGKTYGYYEGSSPILVTSDLEVSEQICVKQFSSFQGRRAFPVEPDPESERDRRSKVFMPHIVMERGHNWKRLRTNANPAFSTGKLKSYMPLVNKSQRLLMAAIKERENVSFDIHELYQLMTLDVIGDIAFGVELRTLADGGTSNPMVGMIRQFLGVIKEMPPGMQNILAFPEIGGPLVSFVKAQAEFFKVGELGIMAKILDLVEDVVEKRAKNPALRRHDMLQSLIDDSDMNESGKQSLSHREVVGQSFAFFIAGTETTSTALAYSSYLLATHKDVQHKLYQEVETLFEKTDEPDYDAVMAAPYLDAVCKETLRIYPIGYSGVNRFVVEDTSVCGIPINKAIKNVMIDIYSIHHNPEYWGPVDVHAFHPDRFLPEYVESNPRPESAFMGFGFGPKLCVGMRLAYLEMKLTLANILHRYRIEEPAGGFPDGLPVKAEFLLLPANGVHVQLVPRC